MALLELQTGALRFDDGFFLTAGMARGPWCGEETPALLPVREADGIPLAAACWFADNRLCGVTLHAPGKEGRPAPGADRQRALLFAALCLRDPCPDTRRGVRVRCAFGRVTLSTDPYTGGATAAIDYIAQ